MAHAHGHENGLQDQAENYYREADEQMDEHG
jgi:hypothetical protein